MFHLAPSSHYVVHRPKFSNAFTLGLDWEARTAQPKPQNGRHLTVGEAVNWINNSNALLSTAKPTPEEQSRLDAFDAQYKEADATMSSLMSGYSLVELRDFEDKWSREKQEALALDNTEQGETSGFSEAVEIALTQWALRDIESTAIEAEEAIANGSIESARILIKTIRDRATSARRESPRFF